ncbi:hypothetical protein ACIBG5_22555 [Kribbella sp. NPDC050241]|uniref:hypothetical protein n=1 Tax=Kribbella sp. NPDC050241 TaxID=3364115 RepID=UPI0037B0B33C
MTISPRAVRIQGGTMADTNVGAGGRGRTVRLVMPIGLIGLLFTAWYTYPGFQKSVCGTEVFRAHHSVNKACSPEHRPVEIADATAKLDAFFRQVGSGRKDNAKDFYTPALRERVSDERLNADWPATVVAVERTAPLQPASEPDQFVVTYRRFDVPATKAYSGRRGKVNRFTQTVRLQGSDHGVLIDDFVASPRSTPGVGEGKSRAFAWITFQVNTVTRRAPSLSADLTRATDVRRGNGLRVLCAWVDEDSRQWFRTYVGWADGNEVDLGQVPAEGVLDCATDGFGVVR